MKLLSSLLCGNLVALTVLITWPALRAQGADRSGKPVILYSLYYNAEGENRYPADGVFKKVTDRLREEFALRIHKQAPGPETFAGVRAVLIANPNDKAAGTNPPPHHMSAPDIEQWMRFINDGGGLIIMGNQENHNLEVTDMNQLLRRFGLQFTNLYTDAKKLLLPAETPVIGGLRWAYYTGNSLRLDPDHPAKPRAWVVNDLAQKPIIGPRDQPGVLLAVAESGKGRIVVVTDSGWITEAALDEKGIGGVTIQGQDNLELFLRLVRWAAHL